MSLVQLTPELFYPYSLKRFKFFLLSKGHFTLFTILYLFTQRTLLVSPCLCPQGWKWGDGLMGPPLSSFPCMRTQDGGQPHHSYFLKLTLLPLSTILQGGDREFSWVGPPLTLVLTYAKVRTSSTGQPLLMTKLLIPTERPNLNPTKLLVPL